MRVIFHGKLRQLYGESFEIHARSVREAVEGLSRQLPDWPRELRLRIPGFDTEESFEEAAEQIHLMPAMQGGSGKFFGILLGAAMIGAAFVTGGATLVGGLKAVTALGGSLLVSGGMMILQGVVGLFMKAPTFKRVQDPEASKYVSINQNTTAVGTPVTLAYGRIQLAGHWLSLQSDSNNLIHGSFPVNPT